MPISYPILDAVEMELPELLTRRDWNSLRVTYEPPEVERVWRTWGEYRILLHCIHPCAPGKPLFHPHPWPSIVKVLAGRYEMGVGHGAGIAPPPVALTMIAGSGTIYAMADRDGWHFVRPLDEPSFSLMITGMPWQREMPRSNHPPQPALAHGRVDELLRTFASRFYPLDAKSRPDA